ncbi:MAG TPA: MaoC/PaaZ C-terminal domain-containing protein [Propionibacteriaceae bacterium]|jgi:acyl dehydratase
MKATVVDGVDIGTNLPALTVRFTRERLVRYAGASTDFNPIHYSEHFARQVGLPGVIAHGMLSMGTALRVVTNWVGDPGRVISYAVRFTRPVVVPDDADGVEVEFGGSVSAIDGSLVTVSIEAISDGQKVLGAARAEVDLGVRVPHRDRET